MPIRIVRPRRRRAMRDRALVGVAACAARSVPANSAPGASPGAAHRRAAPGRRSSRSIAAASSSGSSRIDQRAGAAEHLRQRAAIRRRRPARRRSSLRAPAGRTFFERRLHQQPRAVVQRAPLAPDRRSRCAARCRSSGGRANPLEPRPRRLGRLPGEHELAAGRGAAPPAARRRRAARRRSCAARACRRTACSRRGRPRRAASRPARPGEQTEIRSARHVEQPLDLAGGELRDDDDASARCAWRAGQRRVVAPDLGARALGMRQEVEVVDRDDLRRVARRHQQRMQRVRDVERAAGQRLGRRPLEADARRGSAARPARGDRRAVAPRSSASTRQPILPRAREQRQVERPARRSARERDEQRARQLVRVFADAAALAQRRHGNRSGRALV